LLPGKRPFSSRKFYNIKAAVLNRIEQGKRIQSDEDSLEVVINQWAHWYFYLLSSERFFLGVEEVALHCCIIGVGT
jgi:hypothetical protein